MKLGPPLILHVLFEELRDHPSTQFHAALLTYLHATRANEWSSPDQRGDTETLAALADLERRTRARAEAPGVGSPQASEMLGSLDALTTARRQRLADAGCLRGRAGTTLQVRKRG